jgi:hypothetical protein
VKKRHFAVLWKLVYFADCHRLKVCMEDALLGGNVCLRIAKTKSADDLYAEWAKYPRAAINSLCMYVCGVCVCVCMSDFSGTID